MTTEEKLKEDKMLVVKFGRWSHSALEKYTYDRVYLSGYKWTPFCIRKLRY